MKHAFIATGVLLSTLLLVNGGLCDTRKGEKIDGKKEFEEHCRVCHPHGGNIVNTQKDLHRTTLTANGVKNADDIIAILRKPGPGMTSFDEKTISDKEANAIANYILKTFK